MTCDRFSPSSLIRSIGSVDVWDGSALVADAHALAGQLEEQLRQRLPDIVDVVVRTQP